MRSMEYATDVPFPGHFIREELDARGWSQRDLAWLLGVPEQAVTMIVNGKRGVSPEMAKAMGDAFDVNPDFFANLQKAYDMSKAREPNPGVARRARLQGLYPVREMIKRGWLENTDAPLLEAQMARFFEVSSIAEIPHLSHCARKTNYDTVSPAQLAWLFRVRQISNSMTVPKYSERALLESLSRLRSLLVDVEEIRHVPRILMECGVRFVIVESLPSAKIDGVCFWLGNSAPVIGMSLRFDRVDNFWFVIRHEIEHVLQRHGRDAEILDDLEGERSSDSPALSDEERIANRAAAGFCVSQNEMQKFIARKNPFFAERDVLGFARRVQVHPGIVVGQIQNHTKRWDFLRRHLVKVRQFVMSGAMVDGWDQVAPVSI
ncbi:MAG: HigA family addiction module antitoxin [Methylocella sp.]